MTEKQIEGTIVEISERFDDISNQSFWAIIIRVDKRPNLRFSKKVKIAESNQEATIIPEYP